MELLTIKKSIVLIVVIATICSSCFYNKEEELYGITECTTEIPSYSGEIENIIIYNCSTQEGCHNDGGHHPLLTNYEQINDKAIAMLKRIQNGTMPNKESGISLSDLDKNKIYCWINAGSPNN